MKNRKSNRLKDYDYSKNGMYFVTICTHNREELFGEIINGKIILNELGKIVEKYYLEIPKYHSHASLDVFVIMPNHLHGIIEINDPITTVGADLVSAPAQDLVSAPAQDLVSSPDQNIVQERQTQGGQTQGLSLRQHQHIGLLSRIIQGFKSKSTVEYIHIMKSQNIFGFTKIWQRSFYDRIIRNDAELNRIREYIKSNPQMWERDRNKAENIFM